MAIGADYTSRVERATRDTVRRRASGDALRSAIRIAVVLPGQDLAAFDEHHVHLVFFEYDCVTFQDPMAIG